LTPRRSWDWEPWEARRTSLPTRASWEQRDARERARLLLMVVRAKSARGNLPYEHAEALAVAAEDERLTSRLRLRAATALARLRLAGLRRRSAL